MKNLTITTLTQYQQLNGVTSSTLSGLRYELEDLSNMVRIIKEIYDLDKIQDKFQDGRIAYPTEKSPIEGDCSGSHLEFRYIYHLLFIYVSR